MSLDVDFTFAHGEYSGPAEMVEDKGDNGAIIRYLWKGHYTTIWVAQTEILGGPVALKTIERKQSSKGLDSGPALPARPPRDRCPHCGK